MSKKRKPAHEITVADAALVLGLTSETVRHHIRAGHFKLARRAGARVWLLNPAEVAAFRPARPGPRPAN